MTAVAAPDSMSVEDMEKIMKEIEVAEAANQITDKADGQKKRAIDALDTFVDPEQLAQDVAFNVNDLDNDVMQHAGKFVHYAGKAVAAMRQYERMKAAF